MLRVNSHATQNARRCLKHKSCFCEQRKATDKSRLSIQPVDLLTVMNARAARRKEEMTKTRLVLKTVGN